MVNSNSLLIYIPILGFPIKDIQDTIDYKKKENLDNRSNFKQINKVDLINDSYNLNRRELNKYISRIEFKSKIRVRITLYKIKAYTSNPLHSDLFFIELELYSANFIIDYSKLTQDYVENKTEVLKFILVILKDCSNEFKELKDIISRIIHSYEDLKQIPLLHFSLIFYSYEKDIDILRLNYNTNKVLINKPFFNIAFDRMGRSVLWIINKSSKSSGHRVKVLALRTFLMRLFSWLSKKSELKWKFHDFLKNYYSYFKYLVNLSRDHDIYDEISKINDYNITLKFRLVLFDTFNQSFFFNRSYYRSRLGEIKKFLNKSQYEFIISSKYVFLKANNSNQYSNGIDYLDKRGWNILYFSKDSKTDYDSMLQTFVQELFTLTNDWGEIILITADSNLVNHFLFTSQKMSIRLKVITDPNNSDLDGFQNLLKIHSNGLNIYLLD